MKRIMAMLMSVVLTLGLTACGHTVGDVDLESGQSAVYIQKDGMVSYAVSESFDKDYYDKDELKKYTQILYAQARLIEGLNIENPTELSNLICEVMSK